MDANGVEQTETITWYYGTMPSHASWANYQTAQTWYTFAWWTPDVHSITWDETYRAVYDETFNVSNPTREGYTFSGWKIIGMNNWVTHYYWESTTTATTIENTKETSFRNLHSVTDATVTFTAQWTPIEYTITYDVNDIDVICGD